MKKRHVFLMVLAVVTSLLIAAQGFAQIKTGTIKGTVKDETGQPLPGVSVEVRGEALMGVRTMITESEGSFRFPALPIGKNYEVNFSLEGFQSFSRKNLRLTIAATLVIEIELKPSTLEEEVIVTAEAPLVDTVQTSFSAKMDSDFLVDLPTSHRYMSKIITMSPGITNTSAFGSLRESNAYYLNGADISAPSTGRSWLSPQIDLIEEYEITGIGAPAEYGNFQGMVINCVSKSGSNTFSGAIKLFYRNENLTSVNTPDEKWPYHIDHYHDLILNFGGPIIKDKLWFHIYGKMYWTKITSTGANPDFPPDNQDNILITLMDWQINEKNKISLFYQFNLWQWAPPPTEFQPYETISGENDWIHAPMLEWLSLWNNNTYSEVKFASWFCYLWYDPVDGDLTTPGRVDWGTGYYSDNHQYYYHWWTNRIQVNASVSHFADDFIQGDHDFKFGVQYNRGYSDIIQGYWGGAAYFDWMGYPYAAYFWNPNHYGGIVHQIGGFIDDSWRIADRLTLSLGVRFDYNHGMIPDYDELDANENPTGNVIPGIPDVGNWKTISPRFGLNYQLTSDMKTVFRASYGRYYDALIIGDFQDATPAQATWYAYGYNWDTGQYDDLWYIWEPQADLGLDSDLKAPYTDQFSVGLEREIFPNFSLSATLIYKRSMNVIERINTAAEYEEIPYYDDYGNQTLTVYDQVRPIQNFYLVTNPGDKITYRGLMLVANKRFSDNFQFYTSFVWSRAWYTPVGYEDKNELINAEGPLSNDRRWVFKFGGFYVAPLGIILGTNIIYQQGNFWQRSVRVRLNQGSETINAEPLGTNRLPNQLDLDVKVEKTFRLGPRLRTTLSFDVFNLFNMDTPGRYVSYDAENVNFLVPTSIRSPRIAMLGLQIEF